MTLSRICQSSVAAGLALLLASCKPASESAPPSAAKLDFAADVRPILENRCVNCHHAGALFGHLNIESRAKAFAERPGGPVIIPGEPDKSPFYLVLTLPGENTKAMPPEGHRIPPAEVATIKRWIAEGAAWPEGPDGVVKPLPPIRQP